MSRFDGAYKYRSWAGQPVFEVVRWRNPKHFSQRWRPHPSAPWIWEKPGLAKGDPWNADDFLWRLPHVLRALEDGDPVYWAEGEKDAMALVQRAGVCGTSHHGGAGKATVEQARWLGAARLVVLCIDNDPSGYWCGLRRYRLLTEDVGLPAHRVRVVRPYWPEFHKDVADHLEAGLSLEELAPVSLVELRAGAAKWTPQEHSRAGYSTEQLAAADALLAWLYAVLNQEAV